MAKCRRPFRFDLDSGTVGGERSSSGVKVCAGAEGINRDAGWTGGDTNGGGGGETATGGARGSGEAAAAARARWLAAVITAEDLGLRFLIPSLVEWRVERGCCLVGAGRRGLDVVVMASMTAGDSLLVEWGKGMGWCK